MQGSPLETKLVNIWTDMPTLHKSNEQREKRTQWNQLGCMFGDDVELPTDSRKVVKDLLKAPEQWPEKARIKRKVCEMQHTSYKNSGRTDKYELNGKEINIPKTSIHLGVEAGNVGVSDQRSIG